jgi:hypothetical protein
MTEGCAVVASWGSRVAKMFVALVSGDSYTHVCTSHLSLESDLGWDLDLDLNRAPDLEW